MPKPSTRSFEAPFTAVPNWLVDEVMPTLKDTELRVLLVVVRQTLGWTDGKGGHKQRDWLSQKQLLARTGRNSAAVSAAVDGLVRRELIECVNEQGTTLLMPQQRRACRGRIYYGLGQNVDKAVDNSHEKDEKASAMQKSEVGKANTTKETGDKRNNIDKEEQSSRIQRGWTQAGEIAARRYGQNTTTNKTSLHKANTPS